MKTVLMLLGILGVHIAMAQKPSYITHISSLTREAAIDLAERVTFNAAKQNKKATVVVLDAGGNLLLALKGDQVGPHNTEASRKKAFTAFSTKTASFELMKIAAQNPYSQNLNTVSDLLLLGGGVPIFNGSDLVGSIGVSGAGGSENDHQIAKTSVEDLGFKTNR